MLRRTSAQLLVMLVASLFAAAPAQAQAETFTDNVRIPMDRAVFVRCAAGGAGEIVALTGSLHLLFHVTVDAQGGAHATVHSQFQGVRGVGLTTGDKYQGTGVEQDQVNIGSGGLPLKLTFVTNLRVIGQGPGNNFLVHENVHLTINANGERTADVTHFSFECK